MVSRIGVVIWPPDVSKLIPKVSKLIPELSKLIPNVFKLIPTLSNLIPTLSILSLVAEPHSQKQSHKVLAAIPRGVQSDFQSVRIAYRVVQHVSLGFPFQAVRTYVSSRNHSVDHGATLYVRTYVRT